MLSTDLLRLLRKFRPDTTVFPPRLVKVPALPPKLVLVVDLPPKLPTLRDVSLLCNPRRSPSTPRVSCLLSMAVIIFIMITIIMIITIIIIIMKK